MSDFPFWGDLPDVSVRMERADLEGLPHAALPAGYALRWYRPGDEAHWYRIHADSGGYGAMAPELFREQYGGDEAELARRMAFVCDADGLPVATNTAWFGDGDFAGWGRVHWVATGAAYQGRGVSRPLLAAVCARLRELGHERAYLTTNAQRLPALLLYHRLGFRPVADTPLETEAWQVVAAAAQAAGRRLPPP